MRDVPLIRSHYPAPVRTEASNDFVGIGRNDLTIPYVSFVYDEGFGESCGRRWSLCRLQKREPFSNLRTFALHDRRCRTGTDA